MGGGGDVVFMFGVTYLRCLCFSLVMLQEVVFLILYMFRKREKERKEEREEERDYGTNQPTHSLIDSRSPRQPRVFKSPVAEMVGRIAAAKRKGEGEGGGDTTPCTIKSRCLECLFYIFFLFVVIKGVCVLLGLLLLLLLLFAIAFAIVDIVFLIAIASVTCYRYAIL